MNKRKLTEKKQMHNTIMSEIYTKIDFSVLQQMNDKKTIDRYLVDTIDSIYKDESAKQLENQQRLQGDMYKWSRKNEDPFNLETIILQKQKEEQIKRDRAETEKKHILQWNEVS